MNQYAIAINNLLAFGSITIRKCLLTQSEILIFGYVQAILSPFRLLLVALWTTFCGLSGILVQSILRRPTVTLWVAKRLWSPGMLWIHGVRLEIRGIEKLSGSQITIVASNHESFVDIPVILYSVPFYLFFLCKKELKKIPVVGWYIKEAGMIFIDRQDREKAYDSIQQAGQFIRDGKPVITFPEGHRTKDGKLGLFKRGTFYLALEAGVPVTPMAITGARKVWPSGSLSLRPGKITLSIGTPVSPKDYSIETVDEFADAVRSQVEALQKEVLESP